MASRWSRRTVWFDAGTCITCLDINHTKGALTPADLYSCGPDRYSLPSSRPLYCYLVYTSVLGLSDVVVGVYIDAIAEMTSAS